MADSEAASSTQPTNNHSAPSYSKIHLRFKGLNDETAQANKRIHDAIVVLSRLLNDWPALQVRPMQTPLASWQASVAGVRARHFILLAPTAGHVLRRYDQRTLKPICSRP